MISFARVVAAAIEYREGKIIRREIAALSDNELAKKFGRAHRTIRAIGRGEAPKCVPEDERRLIGACIRERENLEKIYRGKTRDAVTKKYRISGDTLRNHLEDCCD